jgi:hypothetical protein
VWAVSFQGLMQNISIAAGLESLCEECTHRWVSTLAIIRHLELLEHGCNWQPIWAKLSLHSCDGLGVVRIHMVLKIQSRLIIIVLKSNTLTVIETKSHIVAKKTFGSVLNGSARESIHLRFELSLPLRCHYRGLNESSR